MFFSRRSHIIGSKLILMVFRSLMGPKLALLFILLAPGAAAGKHPIAFAGHVEGIDEKHWTVAIRHGNIPGFMPAMTMDYPVEGRDVLHLISVGDDIAATVYVGDPTLHNLRIV